MSEHQEGQPRTWFSGDSSPEGRQNTIVTISLVLLGFALVSPISAILAGISLFLFSRVRISHKVIGGFSLTYLAIILITGLFNKGVGWYLESFNLIVEAIQGKIDFDGSLLVSVLLHQLTLSVFVGTLIGFGLTWYKWFRRPVWQENTFRLGPIQYAIKRRNIKDLKENRNPTKVGATLGINNLGKKIVQTDEEASSHTFVAGASGSGKTTTMMTQAKDHIRRGHGLAFIDLKGATDVPNVLYDYAEKYDREFYHFTIIDLNRDQYEGPDPTGPAYYDALGRGDASRRKDMIIGSRRWSEDHYRILASSYLQTAFNVAIASPPEPGVDSLSDIISLLNPTNLGARARRMPDGPDFDEIRLAVDDWVKTDRLARDAQSAIDGVARELQTLKGSSAGKWLREAPSGKKKINFRDIADRGGVVVFSLDSSNYEQLAAAVANFVIQDLKTVSSELRANPALNPMHIYVDEFSAMDSSNVINLINKARDAKMPVSLSTQALGDLRKVDPTFMDQLLGIINCFIIHRANTEEDMEIYAGLTGKTEKWKARYGVEHTSGGMLGGGLGQGAATGAGTVEEIEDYKVSPREIQELKMGEIVYVAMSPDQRLERVSVIPEEGKTATERDPHRIKVPPTGAVNISPQTEDPTLNMPSLSPETTRTRMRRGLQEDTSSDPRLKTSNEIPEITQTRESCPIDDEDGEYELDLSNIKPKQSSGSFLKGKDINSSLREKKEAENKAKDNETIEPSNDLVSSPSVSKTPTPPRKPLTEPTPSPRQPAQNKSTKREQIPSRPVPRQTPPKRSTLPSSTPTEKGKLPKSPEKTEVLPPSPLPPRKTQSPKGETKQTKPAKSNELSNSEGKTKRSLVVDWDDEW